MRDAHADWGGSEAGQDDGQRAQVAGQRHLLA